ncbi:MAG: UDP-N-acetylmuramate dehydrogenase [Syntrophomonadaceae bacterium]|jgi:UDP-N-acetylmuramate dehydrogenase|nr:UDP-N-acetylmuramate dehydrogenase [Syntrophomonadaceae bacterium]
MYNPIMNIISEERLRWQEPLSLHTSFKVGGPADVMVFPQSIAEIQQLVRVCRQERIPFIVLGLGSNVLFPDRGFRGVVIKLGQALKGWHISGNEIIAEAGIRLAYLSKKAAANSLSGLEFAEGIPGSVGGAVIMNAGAYNGEMSQILSSVSALDRQGDLHTFQLEEMAFSYRSSIFQSGEWIVVSALMKLSSGKRDEIEARMREFARLRREKQPLDMPSAGSTFKRPSGVYVGPLLEKMGLKGFKIGDAQVSTKHAGFIVNCGQATAQDILDLIKHIQQRALAEHNIRLEPEVRIISETIDNY